MQPATHGDRQIAHSGTAADSVRALGRNPVFHSLINAITGPAMIITAEGIVLIANASAEVFFGTGSGSILGKSIHDGESVSSFSDEMRKYAGIVVKILKPAQIDESSGERSILFSMYPVIIEGYPAAVAVVGTDITEQHLAWRVADESREQLRQTFDSIHDGIVFIDINRKITHCNQAAYGFAFAHTQESLIGEEVCHVLHGPDKPVQECAFSRMLRSGRREMATTQVGDRWVEVSCDPVFGANNEITGAVHIARDVSDRVSCNLSLERKNAALEELTLRLRAGEEELRAQISKGIELKIIPLLNLLQERTGSDEIVSMLRKALEFPQLSHPEMFRDPTYRLTPRENQLCTLIRQDRTMKEAAAILGTSVQTVEKQRKSIRRKLGIRGKRLNLAAFLQNLDTKQNRTAFG